VLKKDFDLTPMQINVVFLTAQGANISDAIDLLSVSATTFNHHLNKALFKMSCKHRYELTAKFWSLVSLIESKKIGQWIDGLPIKCISNCSDVSVRCTSSYNRNFS
jgi:DNA-binding CsgD family transcriptional regulator